jgi:hypothetical protein
LHVLFPAQSDRHVLTEAAAVLAAWTSVLARVPMRVDEEVDDEDDWADAAMVGGGGLPSPTSSTSPKAKGKAAPKASPSITDSAQQGMDDAELRALLASTTALALGVTTSLAASSVLSPTNALLAQAEAVTRAETMLSEHHELRWVPVIAQSLANLSRMFAMFQGFRQCLNALYLFVFFSHSILATGSPSKSAHKRRRHGR